MTDIASRRASPATRDSQLQLLVQSVARAVEELEAFAFTSPADERVAPPDPGAEAAAVRTYLRARRLRDDLFPDALFGEPAWDMLLDLYAAELDGKLVSASGACIASAVPATTALRWLARLEETGLIERGHDDGSMRREHIRLTRSGRETLCRWVGTALLHQPAGSASARRGFIGS